MYPNKFGPHPSVGLGPSVLVPQPPRGVLDGGEGVSGIIVRWDRGAVRSLMDPQLSDPLLLGGGSIRRRVGRIDVYCLAPVQRPVVGCAVSE